MNRTEKEQAVEQLAQTFQDSQSVLLLNFQGITVPDITQLRDKIRETGGSYEVVKNRLAIRASVDTPVAELAGLFEGPTAIAYTRTDSVALARTLREFVKSNDGMQFKAGILEGQTLSIDEVVQLAEMPSRDELLSKLLFLVKAPLTQFAMALRSPLCNLASVLSQLAEHKGGLEDDESSEEAEEEPSEASEVSAEPEQAPAETAEDPGEVEERPAESAQPSAELDAASTDGKQE